jgi:PAS domain S-box-containing protein
MNNNLLSSLKTVPKALILVIAAAVTLLVGYFDSIVGQDLIISLFYLIPIAFAAWFGGKKEGLIIVALSTIVNFYIGYELFKLGHSISIMLLNSVFRCGIFIIVSLLISALKKFNEKLGERVELQTKELIQEVQHHKKTEEALIESEQRYRHVVENAIEIIYSTDTDGNFTYVNNAALKTSEYTNEEFLKLNFFDLVVPEYRRRVVSFYIRQYLEKNHATYFEFPFKTKSGAIKWLGQNTLLIKEGDKIKGFYIIARDVTDRKKAEDALKASEIKFRNLAKTAPVALTRMNLTTSTYDFVNDEFIRQSGYTQEEFEKLSELQLIDMIYPEDRERVFNTYRTWQEEGYKGIRHIDYRIVNRNKQIIWLDTYIYSDMDDNGNIISINQIAMDVTEQKALQESIVASDERYRAFITNSGEGIYRIEFSRPVNINRQEIDVVRDIYEYGSLVECNLAFAKMYGYDDISFMVGKTLKDMHGPELHPRNIESFMNFIERGYRIDNQETLEYDKNDRLKFFLNSAVGTIDNGYLTRIWGTQIDITEQKHILEQNRKLSQAVEQSSASIAIMDNNGTIEYINRKFTEITLYESSEVIGTKFNILSNQYDAVSDITILDYLRSGNEWSGEFFTKRKDGKEYWEYTRISPIKDTAGNVNYLIAVAEDITEQRLAEDSIRKSEERYRAFIAQSSEGIYRMELDVPLKITASIEEHGRHFSNHAYLAECNDVMAKMYGFNKAEEVVGLPVRDLVGINEQTSNTISFESFIRSGYRVYNSETRENSRDGRIKYFLNNGIGIIEDGYLVRIWGTQRDITELKTIQEEIRKLSRAVEQSPDCVIITDTSGKIEYVNPKFEEVTGFDAGEVIGKRPYILLEGELPLERYNEIWNTLKEGNDWKGEFYNKKKNGDRYWEYASISPIKDDEGNITHYVYVKEDITQRKTFEIELVEAMQRAEEASKAKSQFLANMSHEIRTPMNGIVGMTQLLSLTNLSEEQREYIEMIRYSSDILLKIINDILDFSKIESGNLNFNEKSFNIRELVVNTCRIFKNDADKKKLAFNCDVDEKIDYHVIGDQYRVNQILINLINNAIKFTPKGSITVSLKEVQKNGNSADLQFAITDTGIGIPGDKFNRLFESFTQLENPYAKQYMGTGLGLSIVKRLVDLMHGDVTVESEPGKGSTFVITLNFRLVEAEILNT